MGRILLIDDEQGTFLAIEASLDAHQVQWAQDETEAQRLLTETPPQLIILDHLLNRAPSVPRFLLALRGKLPAVPILVLTAYGNEDVSIQSFRAGATDYVKKPFDAIDLQRRVELYLACPPSQVRPSLPAYLIASSRLAIMASSHPALRRAIEVWAASGPIRPSLDSLAEAAGVSKRQLIRLFLAVTGMSPRRYFEVLRMQEAAYLLGSADLSISEVSARLEYSDASHFSKVFRKYAGMSPGAFRQAEK